jgi:hypothetical protein
LHKFKGDGASQSKLSTEGLLELAKNVAGGLRFRVMIQACVTGFKSFTMLNNENDKMISWMPGTAFPKFGISRQNEYTFSLSFDLK